MAAFGSRSWASAVFGGGAFGFSAPPPSGAATHVTVVVQPNGGTSTIVFSQQPVVQVRDASEAVVSGSTATVTATLNVVSGSGTLGGTTAINAVNGVATFTNLKVSGSGTFTLTFSSAGLTSATSAQFNITGITGSPYINQATDGTDPGVNFGLFAAQVNVAKTGDRTSATRNMPTGTLEGATLPTFYHNLTVPTKKAGGTTYTVTATGSAGGAQLASFLSSAVGGDEIVIPAGSANRITGNFQLPVRPGTDATPGTDNVIVIRSSRIGELPYGVRVLGPDAAADLGLSPTDVEKLGHVRGTDPTKPVFYTLTNGTQGWRFEGLNIDVDPTIIGVMGSPAYSTIGQPGGYNGPYVRIVNLGDANATSTAQVPKNMVVDRCLIRGHDALHCRVGLGMHCDNSYCIDSTVENIHAVNEGDCQAILSYNCNGNIAVINTSLAASSECIVFGGGANVVAGATMQNVELKWLHIFKPLRWKADEATYAGFQWEIKNLLEVKKVWKMYAEGCYSNKSWPQAQFGYAWLIKNQYNNTTNVYTSDIVIRYCDFSQCAIGIAVMGGTQADDVPRDDKTVKRVALLHCLFDQVGGSRWDPTNEFGQGYRFSCTADCAVVHNTTHQQNILAYILTGGVSDGGDGLNDNLAFRDNIHGFSPLSFKAAGATQGSASMNAAAPGGSIHGCVLIGQPSGDYTGAAYSGNFFPANDAAVKFTDTSIRDYSLLGTQQGGNPPPVATQLDFVLPPGNATSGVVLSQQPELRMLDQFANPIATNTTVTCAVTGGTATGAAIAAGSTAAMNLGDAQFSGLKLTATASGTVQLTFSAPGVTSAVVTITLSVPAPSPTQLVLSQVPSGINTGSPFVVQPKIELRDASNVLVSSATNSVTVAVTSGTAVLSGTLTVAAVNGVVTFTDLVLTGSGTVVLTFTATGLTSVSTGTLAVNPASTGTPKTLPHRMPQKSVAKAGSTLDSVWFL